jgi:hypothetical protein
MQELQQLQEVTDQSTSRGFLQLLQFVQVTATHLPHVHSHPGGFDLGGDGGSLNPRSPSPRHRAG